MMFRYVYIVQDVNSGVIDSAWDKETWAEKAKHERELYSLQFGEKNHTYWTIQKVKLNNFLRIGAESQAAVKDK